MELIYLVLGLALIGFVVWIIVTYIPMPGLFKQLIIVLVAIVIVLYLLNVFAGGSGGHLRLPRF
jgi:hypothetical protein